MSRDRFSRLFFLSRFRSPDSIAIVWCRSSRDQSYGLGKNLIFTAVFYDQVVVM